VRLIKTQAASLLTLLLVTGISVGHVGCASERTVSPQDERAIYLTAIDTLVSTLFTDWGTHPGSPESRIIVRRTSLFLPELEGAAVFGDSFPSLADTFLSINRSSKRLDDILADGPNVRLVPEDSVTPLGNLEKLLHRYPETVVLQLSKIAFDELGTRALVEIGVLCPLCGRADRYLFEFRNGTWIVVRKEEAWIS